MLTHVDFHYLAAILTQIGSPRGVEIELGEHVEDVAAEKPRDVDITVRYHLEDGTVTEMHGIEVKDEGRPLDLVHVEQIIAKLKDMPSLTKHALVSSSGYSEPARRKAKYHGLELYHLKDWDGKGLLVDMSQMTFGGVTTLEWERVIAVPVIQSEPLPGEENERFEFGPELMIYVPSNPTLQRSFGATLDAACKAALDNIQSQYPENIEISKEARFEVNTSVNFDEPFQIPINERMVTIGTVVVQGTALQKHHSGNQVLKVLARDGGDHVAGCAIADFPDGSLWLFMASSLEGSLTARIISVTDRGKKKIFKEKMTAIPQEGPSKLHDSAQ